MTGKPSGPIYTKTTVQLDEKLTIRPNRPIRGARREAEGLRPANVNSGVSGRSVCFKLLPGGREAVNGGRRGGERQRLVRVVIITGRADWQRTTVTCGSPLPHRPPPSITTPSPGSSIIFLCFSCYMCVVPRSTEYERCPGWHSFVG